MTGHTKTIKAVKMLKNITITLPNTVGGVASFYDNLINSANECPHFNIHVILLTNTSEEHRKIPFAFSAPTTEIQYSNLDNHYHFLKRLGSEIRRVNSETIITDNTETIKAIILCGINSTLVFNVHDYYYVKLFFQHNERIDLAICHSTLFKDAIISENPIKYWEKVKFVRYGVTQTKEREFFRPSRQKPLQLFFLGRLVQSKGVSLLPSIDKRLQSQECFPDWTIIGDGPLKRQLIESFSDKSRIQFCAPKDQSEIYSILSELDILIFPSSYEGTPVAIMEALSCGCVVISNKLPGGTSEIINSKLGKLVPLNDEEQFTNAILDYHRNRSTLHDHQVNAQKYAQKNLNVNKNFTQYWELISQKSNKSNNTFRSVIDLSKLDKSYLPNWLVRQIRKVYRS